MDTTAILAANGSPIVSFGGRHSFKQFEHKDYIVSLEWFGPSGREVDACIVIYNARRNSHDAGAWIVGRRQISKYTDGNMNPTPYAFSEAAEALPVLGRNCLDFELKRLVSTLLEYVDDLIKMPPAPLEVKRTIAGSAMFDVTHKEKHSNKVLGEASV